MPGAPAGAAPTADTTVRICTGTCRSPNQVLCPAPGRSMIPEPSHGTKITLGIAAKMRGGFPSLYTPVDSRRFILRGASVRRLSWSPAGEGRQEAYPVYRGVSGAKAPLLLHVKPPPAEDICRMRVRRGEEALDGDPPVDLSCKRRELRPVHLAADVFSEAAREPCLLARA